MPRADEIELVSAVQAAWQGEGLTHDFFAHANALDLLLAQAKTRKEMCERTGEPAPAHYLKAADAELTVSSATVPRIREATAAVRERRQKVSPARNHTHSISGGSGGLKRRRLG